MSDLTEIQGKPKSKLSEKQLEALRIAREANKKKQKEIKEMKEKEYHLTQEELDTIIKDEIDKLNIDDMITELENLRNIYENNRPVHMIQNKQPINNTPLGRQYGNVIEDKQMEINEKLFNPVNKNEQRRGIFGR